MEVWKDIEGFEGVYQVSSFGRIKSMGRVIDRDKMGKLVIFEKILNPHIDQVGYPRLYLYKKNFKRRESVHRLVAFAFIPNTDNKPHINHINGEKTDNRVENLEWCTQKENVRHGFKIGLSCAIRGQDVVTAKIKNSDVPVIKKMRSEGAFYHVIAKKFNVSVSCIRWIVSGINWAHI